MYGRRKRRTGFSLSLSSFSHQRLARRRIRWISPCIFVHQFGKPGFLRFRNDKLRVNLDLVGLSCAREERKSREVSSAATKHKFLERKFRRNSRATCYGYSTSVWLAVARERETRQTELDEGNFLSTADRSAVTRDSVRINCHPRVAEERRRRIRAVAFNVIPR